MSEAYLQRPGHNNKVTASAHNKNIIFTLQNYKGTMIMHMCFLLLYIDGHPTLSDMIVEEIIC